MPITQYDLEMALLANHAYHDDPAIATGTRFEVLIGPDLNPVEAHAANGFFGRAYRDASTGEIAVAFRGSDDGGDYVADAKIFFRKRAEQIDTALEFFRNIRDLFPDDLINITGHSLGAIHAQAVAASRNRGRTTFIPRVSRDEDDNACRTGMTR